MAVTPWRYGSTANAYADGEGRVSNPSYALAVDSQWTTFTSFASPRAPTNTSGLLRVSNFAFTADIPTDATITGVECEVQRSTFGDNGNGYGGGVWVKDHMVRLALTASTAPVGENLANPVYWTPGPIRQPTLESAATNITYGGPTSRWGLNPTRANVVSPNFALHVQAVGVSDIYIGSINYVRVRIYYDVPSPARNVSAQGSLTLSAVAASKHARRASTASSAATISFDAVGSAAVVRRSSQVVAGASIGFQGGGSAVQARRQSSVIVAAAPTFSASALSSQQRRAANVVGEASFSLNGTGHVNQRRGGPMVSMAATLSFVGQTAAIQSRRLCGVEMSVGFEFAASGVSSQQRGGLGVDIQGGMTFSARATVSQVVMDYELRVDPRLLVMVPAENRTVIVRAENRSVTVPIDDRRAK